MDLSFLDGAAGSDETPAPVEIAAEEAASPGQPRDEHGRFASPPEAAPAEPPVEPPADAAPASPEPTPEPAPPQPQSPPAPPPGYVPVAVVEDLRQKLRDREAVPPAQPAAPPPPAAPEIPDPFEDPEGYHTYHQNEVARQVKSATLNMSRMIAVTAHGEEAVSEAMAWAAQRAEVDPTFRQQSWNHHHPVDFAVNEYRQHQLMDKLRADPDAYIRQRALEMGLVDPTTIQPAAPQPAPVAPTAPPAPPKSLATAPAAGGAKPGATPVGPGEAFAATFK